MRPYAVTSEEAIKRVAASIRMPAPDTHLTDALIAQLLRRNSFVLAPSSHYSLKSLTIQSLQPLGSDELEIENRVIDILDALLSYREIVQMPDEESQTVGVRTVLRPAMPTFVETEGGHLILLGVAGDEITPLPDELLSVIVSDKILRMVRKEHSLDAIELLRKSGIEQIDQNSWLKIPKTDSADSVVSSIVDFVKAQPEAGALQDVSVLRPDSPSGYYKGRWSSNLENLDGIVLARRPQKFGSPILSFAIVAGGRIAKFADVQAYKKSMFTYDVGWQFQMAKDALNNNHQLYRVQHDGDTAFIDFFSPLPGWAERKLAVMGVRCSRKKCLFSYQFTSGDLDATFQFLNTNLWLKRDSTS